MAVEWESAAAAEAVARANADALLAPLSSPVFTGDPKAPTPVQGDNDVSIATSAFVQAAVATELDYKELTSTFTTTGVTAANAQDVSGMSILQFVMPAFKPVWLELVVPSFTVDVAGKLLGVIVAKPDNTQVTQFFNVAQGANVSGQLVGRKRLTTADFAAGSTVQLKLRAYVQSGAVSGALLGTLATPVSFSAATK